MFEPTDSNEPEIFNTTGDKGVLSRDQRETEAEPELQCVEDTYSMPVEHKGIAFLLDSCEEAVAGLNMHKSEPPKEIIFDVRGLSIENETQTYFKKKFNCFNCYMS